MTGGRIAVFLDRDGTLNEELGFVRTPDELRLLPGAANAVSALNRLGVVTCVISNQSGIARGALSEADLIPVHARLSDELRSAGAHVDRIYYCPHHPTEGAPPYRAECECRKPRPGMLRQAEQEFGLDLARSFVIGDRMADVQAGRAVGSTTILVLTGYGETAVEESRRDRIAPDAVAPSIVEAVRYVQETIAKESRKHE